MKPQFIPARNNLGLALLQKALWEDAIAEYRKLINLAPDDAEAYYNLGVALKQKQDFDGAIA
ncbi:MAG: hypothetical protein DMG26_14705, partial [Acidobacteria bacterium]